MNRPKIIGIGELVWDMLPGGKQLGGAPVNFAWWCSRLGAEGFPWSAVGDDRPGREALGRLAGTGTESHTDDFEHFDMACNAGIDYISTDLLAPDYRGQGETLCLSNGLKGRYAARIASESAAAAGRIEFGAIWLDIEWSGSATVTLANQTFVLPEAESLRRARHQLMVFDAIPEFDISAPSEEFRITDISLRIVRF